MTCYKCKHEFCWICLKDYSTNHFSAWNVFGGCGNMSNASNSEIRNF
jgi:hypothetical protein